MRFATRLLLASGLALGLVLPTVALAQIPPPCWVPDNGSGTADHPPSYPLGYVGQMQISNGLPPGTTININAALLAFTGLVQVPGGGLGGRQETWTATLQMSLTGTGSLLGYNRNLNIPISSGESHSAPRTLFAPLQSFNTDLFRLQGQIVLDPDFDLLRVTAGTAFGMPSPGHTIFTQNGTGWALDSFFDITYRIDFVGKAGGTFGGMSGSTTGLDRFEMCHDASTPAHKSTWGRLKQLYR